MNRFVFPVKRIFQKIINQINSFPNIAPPIVRKFAAILLLLIFLFNLVGYRWVFNYAQQQSDVQVTASLDKHQYNDADLITIKVPLSMPYQTVQSDFERVDGEININGTVFKYVKRKIVNGEMVLMCLPDNNKMRIQSAKDDFFKTTNDIAGNNTSKKDNSSKTDFHKNLSSDYEQDAALYHIAFLNAVTNNSNLSKTGKLLSSPHTPPVQPPDRMI